MAERAARGVALPVRFIEGSAEAIPLARGSVDTVLTTWTLCTIPAAVRALEELRRVPKPAGRLLLVEPGPSPDAGGRRWADRRHTPWHRIAGRLYLTPPHPAP